MTFQTVLAYVLLLNKQIKVRFSYFSLFYDENRLIFLYTDYYAMSYLLAL